MHRHKKMTEKSVCSIVAVQFHGQKKEKEKISKYQPCSSPVNAAHHAVNRGMGPIWHVEQKLLERRIAQQ